MRNAAATFFIFFVSIFFQVIFAKDEGINGLENSPLTEVWAVVGGHVLLPCNMDPPIANDSTHLVLFYYGDAGTPIYSLDSRGSRLEAATHWADVSVVSRAFVMTDPGKRGLLLEEVTTQDQGHYRCRVDFLESPTRNSRIKLTVVVPPEKVRLTSNLDAGHDLKGMVGPYTLGTEVIYTCQVTGGTPRPRVSWWDGDLLLDNISEVMSGQMTSNDLYQPPLIRRDFNKTLTCVVSNSDLLKPLTASIAIDMTYPPTSVLLEDGEAEVTLREGVAKRISCEVKGSRPPAKIIWRMGERTIYDIDGAVEEEEEFLRGDRTRSIFTHIAGVRDDAQVLECSAYNPSLPHVVLKNRTKLSVLYKPRMELRPDTSLHLRDLRENGDVTLRCLVDANPSVTGVQWAHNGVPIQAMPRHGVVVTQGTLTLMGISRSTSGNYTCAAANTEGATTSNTLLLEIKFAPVCSPGQKTVFGAARHEQLNVLCEVDAHPTPNSFRWAVNTSTGLMDIALNLSSSSGSRSTVRYTPQTHLDFGDVVCWATNDVGSQRLPCLFQIIPAAKPEAVTKCAAERNATMPASYVVVSCNAGWGGGLNQSFTLEVRQQATEEILEKFSLATSPTFVITGLKIGVPYLLTVTAANSRGSSPPVTVSYTAPKASSADKVISPHSAHTILSFTPLLLVLVGVLVGVLTCVGVGVFIGKKGRWRRNSQMKKAYSTSLRDMQDNHDLPTIVRMNKDEMLRHSTGNGSAVSLCVSPGKLLNNRSTASLDNEVLLLKEKLSVPGGRAPLARTDSLEGSSTASSIRISSSRPHSIASQSSFALNPDYFLKEDYLRRDNYLTKSNYLTKDNYLTPGEEGGGYLMSGGHYLAKSDNLIKESYFRCDTEEAFRGPPPPFPRYSAPFIHTPRAPPI